MKYITLVFCFAFNAISITTYGQEFSVDNIQRIIRAVPITTESILADGRLKENIWKKNLTESNFVYRDFGVTASGVSLDYYHPQDNQFPKDLSFDPVWDPNIQQTSEEWQAETKIPFLQLRLDNNGDLERGFNIKRWIPIENEDSYLALIPKNETEWDCRFGRLVGIEQISRSRNIEIIPYVASNGVLLPANPTSQNPFYERFSVEPRIGGDIQTGLGSNLTLETTINPDFGQVEASHEQVNLKVFETLIYRLKDDSWELTRKETRRYYDHGKIKELLIQDNKDGKWIDYAKMTYTYDENFLEKIRIWHSWTGSDWSMLRFRSQRNDKGLIFRELVDRYEEGDWHYVRKNETTYEKDSDRKLEQFYYNPSEDGMKLSWKNVFKYKENNLLRKIGFAQSNQEWVKTLITYYSYDEKGRRVKEEIREWVNGEERNFRKTEFEYSEEGEKVKTNVGVWKDVAWIEDERQVHHF